MADFSPFDQSIESVLEDHLTHRLECQTGKWNSVNDPRIDSLFD